MPACRRYVINITSRWPNNLSRPTKSARARAEFRAHIPTEKTKQNDDAWPTFVGWMKAGSAFKPAKTGL